MQSCTNSPARILVPGSDQRRPLVSFRKPTPIRHTHCTIDVGTSSISRAALRCCATSTPEAEPTALTTVNTLAAINRRPMNRGVFIYGENISLMAAPIERPWYGCLVHSGYRHTGDGHLHQAIRYHRAAAPTRGR